MRIVFAGTPEFAVPPLNALIASGQGPLAVLTQPDRPAGRGRKLRASPVKQVAVEAGIPYRQPTSLRDDRELDWLAGLQPDLLVVVAYGLILPRRILELPRLGCWNIHASLLPRWRGAAPIQRAIEHGDEQTGVCIMEMEEGLDTGPVLHRIATPISGTDTGGSLHNRLAGLGADALLHCLARASQDQPLPSSPQSTEGVTYARKLEKGEARLDWREPAQVLERRVRAFDPWPVAWCMIGTERMRVWKAEALTGGSGNAGMVRDSGPHGIDVETGEGVLRLLELQRPGKRRTAAADYLNAVSLPGHLDSPG